MENIKHLILNRLATTATIFYLVLNCIYNVLPSELGDHK